MEKEIKGFVLRLSFLRL